MLYKYSGEIAELVVSQNQLGVFLGLSQQRISQLESAGVMIRVTEGEKSGLLLAESLRSYYLSIKTSDEGLSFWKERTLHEKAKRELAELKLRERQGELYEAQTVEMVLVELLTEFRNKLLGVGHKLALQLENQSASVICGIIDKEITSLLTELSEDTATCDFKEVENGNSGNIVVDG